MRRALPRAKDFILGEHVQVMFAQIRVERPADDVYVVQDRIEGQALINLQRPWRRIRKLAGLEDVHIHDLRHSYAATAIAAGQNIRIVGAQLGHTQIQTTMRYARVALDPLHRAKNQVSGAIAALAAAQSKDDELAERG